MNRLCYVLIYVMNNFYVTEYSCKSLNELVENYPKYEASVGMEIQLITIKNLMI